MLLTQLDLSVLGQQDVLALDVPVDDLVLVQVGQTLLNRGEKKEGSVRDEREEGRMREKGKERERENEG